MARVVKVQKRYTLNANQVHILKLTYKFRFMTAPLLAKYKGLKTRHTCYRQLEILSEQGYLGKRIQSNESFANKGTRYYLTPQARRYLLDNHNFNGPALSALYNNKTVGTPFIDHSIGIFRVYLVLRDQYPSVFHLFTLNELSAYDNFPEPKPDLYLNKIEQNEGATNEYLAYLYTDTQPFIIKKQFGKLLEHFDSGEWEAGAETPYPGTLYILEDAGTEKRLQHHIAKVLENAGIDDLQVYTTTVKALYGATQEETIWSSVYEPEKLVALTSLA